MAWHIYIRVTELIEIEEHCVIMMMWLELWHSLTKWTLQKIAQMILACLRTGAALTDGDTGLYRKAPAAAHPHCYLWREMRRKEICGRRMADSELLVILFISVSILAQRDPALVCCVCVSVLFLTNHSVLAGTIWMTVSVAMCSWGFIRRR